MVFRWAPHEKPINSTRLHLPDTAAVRQMAISKVQLPWLPSQGEARAHKFEQGPHGAAPCLAPSGLPLLFACDISYVECDRQSTPAESPTKIYRSNSRFREQGASGADASVATGSCCTAESSAATGSVLVFVSC